MLTKYHVSVQNLTENPQSKPALWLFPVLTTFWAVMAGYTRDREATLTIVVDVKETATEATLVVAHSRIYFQEAILLAPPWKWLDAPR